MKNLSSKIFTAVFFSLLLLPLLLHLLNRFTPIPIHNTEKRKLATLPLLPTSTSKLLHFPRAFDNYINDNIPIRMYITKYYHTFLYLLNQSASERIILGRDGWIFNNYDQVIDQLEGKASITPEIVRNSATILADNYHYFSSKEIQFFYYIAPDKHSIYPEFLPAYIQPISPISQNQSIFSEYIKKHNLFPLINVKESILHYKELIPFPIYYKGDTHWKFIAAYAAYEQIMKTFRIGNPRLDIVNLEQLIDSECEEYFGLFERLGTLPIFSETGKDKKMDFKNITNINWRHKSKVLAGRRNSKYKNKSLESGKKILLIGDSFNGYIAPFFAHSFSEVVVTYHNNGNWDTSILDEFEPDFVIYETLERFLIHPLEQTNFK